MSDLDQNVGQRGVDAAVVNRSRYEVIAALLQDKRDNITKPLKLPSEVALAVKHNVARDTIRRAIKVLEERGEVTRKRGRGTFLLPGGVGQIESLKGAGVGFIPPWWADSTEAWYTSMVFGGVCDWADKHDWHLSVIHIQRKGTDINKLLKKISARRLRSLVWLQPMPAQMEVLNNISKHIPCVVVGREYEDSGLHIVEPDYSQAAKLIDDYLVRKGHLSYAVMGGSPLGPYGSSWIRALQKTHQDRGSTFGYWENYIDIKPFHRDRLAELVMDLYLPVHPKIQALVLTSSGDLLPLLANKKFRKLVPSGLSIIAFDYGVQNMNSYWTGRTITHVRCDWARIGRKAMSIIGLLLDGQSQIPRVIRESVDFVPGQTVCDWSPDKVKDGIEP